MAIRRQTNCPGGKHQERTAQCVVATSCTDYANELADLDSNQPSDHLRHLDGRPLHCARFADCVLASSRSASPAAHTAHSAVPLAETTSPLPVASMHLPAVQSMRFVDWSLSVASFDSKLLVTGMHLSVAQSIRSAAASGCQWPSRTSDRATSEQIHQVTQVPRTVVREPTGSQLLGRYRGYSTMLA